MKKIYSLSKYSGANPILEANKILAISILRYFTLLFFLFFFSKSQAQESSIFGLENLHVANGAIIITETSTKETMVITASSSKILNKGTIEEIEKKERIVKTKVLNANKNKIAKSKIEQKTKEPVEHAVIYGTNSKSNASFEITNSILKQGTTNYNYNLLVNSGNNWSIRLAYYQNRDNILYLFYHSKKVEDTLFARPPPYLC